MRLTLNNQNRNGLSQQGGRVLLFLQCYAEFGTVRKLIGYIVIDLEVSAVTFRNCFRGVFLSESFARHSGAYRLTLKRILEI